MKIERKYYYRYLCTAIFAIVVTLTYGIVWYRFAKENNVTGHLLGTANIAMSIGIYLILYLLMGKYLRTFKIGVDRKNKSDYVTDYNIIYCGSISDIYINGSDRTI